jgi:uncharacterized membrane protein YeaQ/YmgE (transglycosylase-associated protein family)
LDAESAERVSGQPERSFAVNFRCRPADGTNPNYRTFIQPALKENVMHLSNQSLLVILLVGIIAGWLAGRVMEGGGFGLIGDLLVGLVGAFIGNWLLPKLGIHLGLGIVAAILNAFIGAVVLLLILRLLNGGWGYRRRWSNW